MKDKAERNRIQAEELRLAKERAEERRRAEEQLKLEQVDVEFDGYISDHIGVSQEQREALEDDKDSKKRRLGLKQVSADFHFLIPEPEHVRDAFEKLTKLKVIKVFRNQNETLIRRYLRAKELLGESRKDGGTFPMQNTELAKQVKGKPPYDFLGPYDASINELPLWHGTPSADAAGGICSIGFDTNHVTTHVWGHGFYFADNVATSAAYCRGGFHVNSKYSQCKVMMMCRVLAGRIHKTSAAPTQDQQERLVGECLGPGGCFGAQSTYHSIYGGGYAYVCAHRDQVFPAYVIIYS